jgi:hypothetical protein
LIAARLATRRREETLVPIAPHRAPTLEVEFSTSSVSAGQAAEMLNVDRARRRGVIPITVIQSWPTAARLDRDAAPDRDHAAVRCGGIGQ